MVPNQPGREAKHRLHPKLAKKKTKMKTNKKQYTTPTLLERKSEAPNGTHFAS